MNISELFSVKDKVVLVTGGSRGIGLMIATAFVENGAKVYITSRTAKVCDEAAAILSGKGPGSCISIPANLQEYAECKRLVDEISKRGERLDVLVNNAGANWGAPLHEYPDSAFTKVLNLNVQRVFTLTQLCVPLLEKAASPMNPARVIMIGSIDGIRSPSLSTFAYSSSKAALHHLSSHLASHLGDKYITVNAVAPVRLNIYAGTL